MSIIFTSFASGPVPSGVHVNRKKAAAALYAQRVLRTTCHKIHTVALLANARTRNKWLNDPLLHVSVLLFYPTLITADSSHQARLLSITPLALQNGFAMIHKSRVPDQNKRGRIFEAAVDRLVTWWCETFFFVTSTGHIRSRTFEEVEDEIALVGEPEGSEPDNRGSERIRSVESLMKHVLLQRGSRDTSAQLFTALCRALDIPARLVVSLQSVPWKSKVGKPAPRMEGSKGKGKAPQRLADDHEDLETDAQGEMEDVSASPSNYKGTSRPEHIYQTVSRKNAPSVYTHILIYRKRQGDSKPSHQTSQTKKSIYWPEWNASNTAKITKYVGCIAVSRSF